ncbi:MAG: hypothetical protein ACRD98_00440 [Nitrososphaera sp.]
MAEILFPPSFSWHLTRERICDKALEKISELGVGDGAPSAASRNLCLEALEGVLKFLQMQGLQWPNLTRNQVDITLFKDLQQTNLPADYYDLLEINFIQNGKEQPLTMIRKEAWHAIPDKFQKADFPRCGFADNHHVLWTWPIQNQTLGAKLMYQRAIEDTRSGESPKLRAPWAFILPWGVAAEIAEEFEVSPTKILRLETKWKYYRDLALRSEIDQTDYSPLSR